MTQPPSPHAWMFPLIRAYLDHGAEVFPGPDGWVCLLSPSGRALHLPPACWAAWIAAQAPRAS